MLTSATEMAPPRDRVDARMLPGAKAPQIETRSITYVGFQAAGADADIHKQTYTIGVCQAQFHDIDGVR